MPRALCLGAVLALYACASGDGQRFPSEDVSGVDFAAGGAPPRGGAPSATKGGGGGTGSSAGTANADGAGAAGSGGASSGPVAGSGGSADNPFGAAFDSGDGILDSTGLVDDFRWAATPASGTLTHKAP